MFGWFKTLISKGSRLFEDALPQNAVKYLRCDKCYLKATHVVTISTRCFDEEVEPTQTDIILCGGCCGEIHERYCD